MENNTTSPAPKKPYRLWRNERRFYTMDVLAATEEEAMKPARWAACLPTEQNQRASFPPSTAMDAPVMKDALSDATNRMV